MDLTLTYDAFGHGGDLDVVTPRGSGRTSGPPPRPQPRVRFLHGAEDPERDRERLGPRLLPGGSRLAAAGTGPHQPPHQLIDTVRPQDKLAAQFTCLSPGISANGRPEDQK